MGNSPDGKHRLVHVLKYILENCDEEYPAFSATSIQEALAAEEININADRRAIYTISQQSVMFLVWILREPRVASSD